MTRAVCASIHGWRLLRYPPVVLQRLYDNSFVVQPGKRGCLGGGVCVCVCVCVCVKCLWKNSPTSPFYTRHALRYGKPQQYSKALRSKSNEAKMLTKLEMYSKIVTLCTTHRDRKKCTQNEVWRIRRPQVRKNTKKYYKHRHPMKTPSI